MRKLYITTFGIIASLSGLFADSQGHKENGTSYGDSGVLTYSQMKHGPDGALFLDPYFLPFLQDLQGEILLDAGCGAGPWSIYAAKNGATVYGVDIQDKMIEKAKLAAIEEQVGERVAFAVGDVGNLGFQNDFFDRAISINVGCNLPSLEQHIQELHRVLKKGGIAIITAPASFEVMFTDGLKSDNEVIADIQKITANESILSLAQKCDHIYRATFAQRNGDWNLVQNEADLSAGEEIWRKIPKMIVPNYYHSEQEYLTAFEKNGFHLNHSFSPHFTSDQARDEYNLNQAYPLGSSYVKYSPMVIFVIEKL